MGIKGRIVKSKNEIKPKRKIILKNKKGLTHSDLVKKGIKWIRSQNGKNWNAPISFGEVVSAGMETPDVMGFSSSSSTLIECKVSKSDFNRDKKKMFRSIPQKGMGNYRLYMCPTGLISEEELPDSWGLIYVSDGGKANLIVKPKSQYCNLQAEHAYMYSIMRRICNGTNNDIKDFLKKYT